MKINQIDHLSKNFDEFPIFKGISEPQVTTIYSQARPQCFLKKDILFLAGNQVKHLYLVQQGTVKEYYTSPSGEECMIQRVCRGECLALPSLFHAIRHTTNAEAMNKVQLLRWKATDFFATLRTNHTFCRNILKMLAGHLECAHKQRCFCHKASADTRVAHFLINRLRPGTDTCLNCPTPCLDLRPLSLTAQEIGLARETLTRVLGRMNKQGCIKLCRGRITVCNLDQVRNLAQDGF